MRGFEPRRSATLETAATLRANPPPTKSTCELSQYLARRPRNLVIKTTALFEP